LFVFRAQMHIAVLACRKCDNGNFHSAVRLFMFLNTISCICKNFMFGVGGFSNELQEKLPVVMKRERMKRLAVIMKSRRKKVVR
jgi:hypothetical protein